MENPEYFRLNLPTIAAEIIDGEAVLINFDTGDYYSLEGEAVNVFGWLTGNIGRGAILAHLAAIYADPLPVIAAALDGLIANLIDAGLIIPAEPPMAPTILAAPDLVPASRPTLAPFVLRGFTDMRELLLLDPIHDVDRTGWPLIKAEG